MATAEWNLDRVLHGFKVVGLDVQRHANRAVRREAERILGKSAKLVPWITSTLRDSRYQRSYREGGVDMVEIGYSAEYALAVHEIPRPKSSNGVWKYLEKPYLEALTGYNERVAREVRRGLRRGGR